LENEPRIEVDSMPQRHCDAKDEMNLAEFPLCSLAHRLSPEVKTLRFEDRIWDKGRNQFIARKLTISGSDEYGLPTEKDDEVLLGLIQLTRAHGFAERKVPFTRHELIRILGWRDDSKSYARIEESLNRWTGVTLYYDNAWWNKDRKCWMNEKFHILDNVWLCHRGQPTPDTGLPVVGSPQSAFVWNETIFRSFTHGNLKSIDHDFFKSLKSAVAKRLYRFLDKRFWQCERREFDLRELCCEHIGLSRNYDAANLKRKLLKGVTELEQRGFIRPQPPGERFTRVRCGKWNVSFASAPAVAPASDIFESTQSDPLVEVLVQRGVSPSVAMKVAGVGAERIRHHVAVFDWLVGRRDARVSRNPAGFLVCSIERNYSPPNEFPGEKTQEQNRCDEGSSLNVRRNYRPTIKSTDSDYRDPTLDAFWESLSEREREEAEDAAMAQANALQKSVLDRGGRFASAARKVIRDSYASRQLAARSLRGN
jgi:hypothetical protein